MEIVPLPKNIHDECKRIIEEIINAENYIMSDRKVEEVYQKYIDLGFWRKDTDEGENTGEFEIYPLKIFYKLPKEQIYEMYKELIRLK